MTDRVEPDVETPARPSWWTRAQGSGLFVRFLSAGVALGSGTALGIARWLEPATEGHATHTQLGFGQCTILQATGWPCPMCGATTSWALMADLHPFAAFYTQPFGALLFLLAVATLSVAVAEVVQPRARWSRLSQAIAPYDPWVGGGALVLMTLGWIWKVHLMRGWM